jgi:Uma2 family endonuclease
MEVLMTVTPAFDAPRPVKLTVDDFAVLHDAGAFAERHHAELIEGAVVETSPQRRRHSFPKNELTYRLRVALERSHSRLTAQSEVTVALSPHSAPEPDVVVTDAPRGEGYVPVESIYLVIEISDTTLRWDLTDKQTLYAEAEVPEYWMVDVVEAQLHRFWSPTNGRYRAFDIVPLAGELRSATRPELAIDGSGIL